MAGLFLFMSLLVMLNERRKELLMLSEVGSSPSQVIHSPDTL